MDCVDITFRKICKEDESKEEKNENKKTRDLRLKKQGLKKYLTKKYNSKLANKLCNLFDWNNPLDHKTFFMAVNDLFICNKETPNVEKDAEKNQSICLK